MTYMQKLDTAVIGDRELVTGLRLAGISKFFLIEDGREIREEVRKALTSLIEEPDTGVIIIQEDYLEHVSDMVNKVRDTKMPTPVIIEVPAKSGTKHPDVKA